MAKQVSKTAFMNRMKKRAKGGWSDARTTEAKAKGAQLPSGIVNGVAQFAAYKMDFDKKGNPYIMLQGIVHEPEECTRLKASTFHRITESKDDKGKVRKTVQDKLEDLASDLQLLGCDVSGIEMDDIPELLEALVEAAPFYRFNTVQFGNGPVNVFIQGAADDYEGEPFDVEGEPDDEPEEAWEVGNRVQVDYDGEMYAGEITAIDEEAETATVSFDDGSEANHGFAELVAEEGEESPDEEEPEDEGEEAEWEAGQRVTVEYDGEPYPGEITAIDGETATIAFDDGSEADHDFSELSAEEDESEPEEEGGEEEEGDESESDAPEGDEDWEPAKGESYKFKANARAKPTVGEITSVSKTKQTVNIKTEDGKIHKDIPWDGLDWPE